MLRFIVDEVKRYYMFAYFHQNINFSTMIYNSSLELEGNFICMYDEATLETIITFLLRIN